MLAARTMTTIPYPRCPHQMHLTAPFSQTVPSISKPTMRMVGRTKLVLQQFSYEPSLVSNLRLLRRLQHTRHQPASSYHRLRKSRARYRVANQFHLHYSHCRQQRRHQIRQATPQPSDDKCLCTLFQQLQNKMARIDVIAEISRAADCVLPWRTIWGKR